MNHISPNAGNLLLIGAVGVAAVVSTLAILHFLQRFPATRNVATGGLQLFAVNAVAA